MKDHIAIFDTTLRDGEQSAGVNFSAADKLAIATRLSRMGVDVIEAGFPAASDAERHAVHGVARAIQDSVVCALARAVPGDIDAAAQSLVGAARPRIHVFINASDLQLAQQLRAGREQVLERTAAMVSLARERVAEVEFSAMDATRADRGFLKSLVGAAIGAGAGVINLPDTVGCARPAQVFGLFAEVRRDVPGASGVTLSFHGQDDLGLATANSLAAVEAGARQVEVAVNGIGERAGNTAFEEVVMALRLHGDDMGVTTGVDTRGVYEVSRLVEATSGLAIPANKAVVGSNAFRHASGIHQDGVLKHRQTYEAIDPEWVGHPVGTEIVLGKLSGRAGFMARAQALGFTFSGAAAEQVFRRFQTLADRVAFVDDDALRGLCRAVQVATGGPSGAA